MPGEFDIIQRYFAPLAGPDGLALKDDASVSAVPSGYDLVVTKDVLNEGVHFRAEDPIDLVAFKAIAVSVSDCCSKGATPKHYWVGLSLPSEPTNQWLQNFCHGLDVAQQEFGCCLSGGDTTKTLGPLAISVTVAGFVPTGQMIKRSGAKVRDSVYVTGELGNAALGLEALLAGVDCPSDLQKAYQAPVPPCAFGQQLHGIASASADISDGLGADARHIADASGVLIELFQPKLPIGTNARAIINESPDLASKIWSGGDDYQILFTASESAEPEIQQIAQENKVLVTKIGVIKQGTGVQLLDHNQEIVQVTSGGYEHF
ncbi:MAG: thiamine-phosphate kinase [Kordiimonadaceae bacterium]|nr:thiamine-phosphate kinase [Kordiimonadaceae bacterium]MBO6570394.1 thiamine-phosphate kinase [Kordiimonadaceae bacterium]MBO6965508.1 thiamine-phosphate kinase [Kordiimonadaceae bacterium]